MHIEDLSQAKRLTRNWQRSSQKTGKKLRRANALLREAAQQLHDLPDHHCPTHLLQRIRLHLHAADAETAPSQEQAP